MESRQDKLLNGLQSRIEILMKICTDLYEENQVLTARLKDCKNLAISRTFAGKESSQDDLEATKQRISKLVQDVEKCITLLQQ
jgi:hypothetical protein